ncbi:MAG: peptidoglycan-binding domain-containing protein, partial [Rivularia sp. (in: cyanobacteria)]
ADAVKAFQKRNGLEPDGVVGGATWQLLDKR